MEASLIDRHPHMRDALSLVVFVVCVILGTLFINAYVFRSFSVSGLSSYPTLDNGDRLIVSRVPVTWNQIQNKTYVPERGQFIVFKNPQWVGTGPDEYVIKRVIAFSGERVVIKDGKLTVYNNEHPDGFNPDKLDVHGTPRKPISGEIDEVVDPGTLFVMGDNRIGSNSEDSRNGLGLIPLSEIIGPVSVRIYPFNKIGLF